MRTTSERRLMTSPAKLMRASELLTLAGAGVHVARPPQPVAGVRSLIDDLHAELARQGHPDVRPAHGFALQAIGAGATTAAELGRWLGVSKQAAGKTIDRLAARGYLIPDVEPGRTDARRRAVRLTDAGVDVLQRSAVIFDQFHADWDRRTGGQVDEMTRILRTAVGPAALRTDAVGWLG